MNLPTYRLTLITGLALLAGSATLHAGAYGVSRGAAVRGPNGNVAVARRTTVAGGNGAAGRTTVAVGGNGNVAVARRTTVVARGGVAVVRPLPRGYVRVVPTGYRTVVYGGYNCYYVGNVYYRAVFYEGETVYVIVH